MHCHRKQLQEAAGLLRRVAPRLVAALFCLQSALSAQQFSSVYTTVNGSAHCEYAAADSEVGGASPMQCAGPDSLWVVSRPVAIDNCTYTSVRIVRRAGGASADLALEPPRQSQSASSSSYWDEQGRFAYGSVVEWRLADGRPFAVICRVKRYRDGACPEDSKAEAELLIARGLGSLFPDRAGMPQIKKDVDARKNPKANEAIRRIVDDLFRQANSSGANGNGGGRR